MPRAAATLGFEFIDADVEGGTIEIAFKATEAFTNPMGNVLGRSWRRCCTTRSGRRSLRHWGQTSFNPLWVST
jgi:hypothetical protein